jgi:hypothetical protein
MLRALVLAAVVGGIAALVGGQPITTSDVRHRAAPALRLADQQKDLVARTKARQAALRTALDALIDERLVAAESERLHVEARSEEVERTLSQMAAQNGRSLPELLRAAGEQGYSEDDYRAIVRAQILEMKLVLTQQSALERGPGESMDAWTRRLRMRVLERLRQETVVEIRWAP